MSLPKFEIDDGLSLTENLQKFSEILNQLDPELGPVLRDEIDKFINTGDYERAAVLNRLLKAMSEPKA